ncbi:MAG: hypothetical protein JST05_05580 [Acidobacteria bacterium]|nr:hypothetical protein [Acidobacteriota bacterium]
MSHYTRFRLPLGAVLLGLVASIACGRKEESAAAVAPAVSAAQVTVVSQSGASAQAPAPHVLVQADSLVSAGTPGHVVAAGGDPGLTYKWYVDDGKIEGSAEGNSILWTAGGIGYTHIYCAGTNEAGAKTVAMATVKVVEAPSIARFDALPPAVVPGGGTSLGWDVKGATKLILEPGGQDVTAHQGPGLAVQPKETTIYTLTATNEAGTVVTKDLTVRVVPPPAVARFEATGRVAAGQPLTLVGEFTGGRAEIKKGDAVIATSNQSPIQVQDTLKDGDVYTLVVTGDTGAVATATRSFNLQK